MFAGKNEDEMFGSSTMAEMCGKKRYSWGLVLTLLGINLVALVKVIIGRNIPMMSILVSIVSLLLMCDFRKLHLIHKSNLVSSMVFWFMLYTFGLAIFAGTPLMASGYGLVYQAFYIVEAILIWNLYGKVDSNFCDYALRVLYYLSGAMCIVAFLLIINNFRLTGSIFFNGLGTEDDGSGIISRASTGSIAFTMLAAFFATSNWKFTRGESLLRKIFLCISLVVLVLSNRRTANVSVILVLVIHIRNNLYVSKSHGVSAKKFFRVIFAVAAFGMLLGSAYSNIEIVKDVVDRSVESLIKGVSTFTGGNQFDLAASYRRQKIEYYLPEYFNNFNLLHFIIGRGYMYEWLDVPILQAFVDMGLFGGLFFCMVHVFIPVILVLKKTTGSMTRFSQYYLCSRIIADVASGTPYAGSSCIIIAALLLSIEKQQKEYDAMRLSL